MTPSSDPMTAPRLEAWSWLARASLWTGLAALVLLLRPYRGLFQDGRIYMGRALANLDPAGVGRDLMFVYDSQTGFSLFPKLATALVRLCGVEGASMALSLAGLALWFLAATGLSRRLDRANWAALIVCVLALPAAYGGFSAFSFAEPYAGPRIFAEAGVLAALACLIAGRRAAAILLLAAAGLFHPLMALPGAAVAGVVLATEDRRWLWAGLAALVLVLAAAGLGLPVVGRLFQPIDPAWLEILRTRSAYLFPTLWPAAAFAQIAAQAGAILIAALTLSGRPRLVLLAILGVGLGGLILALLAADLTPSLLLAQLQVWRALWLMGWAGNASLAVAAIALWRQGGPARLVLALMAMSWMSLDSPALCLLLAGLALGAHVLNGRGRLSGLSPFVVRAALACAGFMALVWFYLRERDLLAFVRDAHAAGVHLGWSYWLAGDLHSLPLAALAIGLAAAGVRLRGRWAVALGALVALLLALSAAQIWDDRTAQKRSLEAGAGSASFAPLVAGAPGDILWIDGDIQAWRIAGRPNWSSAIQGGPMLFSRPLALILAERGRRLVASGLALPHTLAPFTSPQPDRVVQVTAPALAELCARPGAPAAVVAPGDVRGAAPAGLKAGLWMAPVADADFITVDGRFIWRRWDRYTVIRCR